MTTIIRGEDSQFNIKLKELNGDPYDITDLTSAKVMIRGVDASLLEFNTDVILGVAAHATYEGVIYTADEVGVIGDGIVLVFDGTKTIKDVIDAYNAENPANTVSHNSPTDLIVPSAGTCLLAGWADSYQKVEPISPEVLGKFSVLLLGADTENLKTGKNLPVYILLAKGRERKSIVIENAINVVDSP